MTQHAELLMNARELADKLEGLTGIPFPGGRPGGTVIRTPPTEAERWRGADVIRGLAKLVEEQDARLVECGRAIVDAENHKIELEAACVTCDEVMTYGLRHGSGHDPMWWTKFRAARHLARLAVKREKAEGGTDRPPEPPAPPPDWDRFHELLDIMGQKELSRSEQAEYDRFHGIAAQLDVEEGKVAEAAQDNLVKGHECIVASIRRLTDAVRADAKQSAKPVTTIKVEMRQSTNDLLTGRWECLLGGCWLRDPIGENHFLQADLRRAGERWLAALSAQLGVPLEAVWEEGVDTEAKCQRCKRPVARIRGEVPMICSGCASGGY